MDNRDVLTFTKIEKELSLFDREYANVHYWQYLRFSVCESLFGNTYKQNKQARKQTRRSSFKNMINIIRDIKKDFMVYFSMKHADLVVFRQVFNKEKFFDYWMLPTNVKTYTFRTKYEEKNDSADDNHFGIPKILMNLKKIFDKYFLNKEFDQHEHEFLMSLEKKLKEIYGQSMSCVEMEEAIVEACYIHRYYKRYFSKMFTKLDCKAILTIVYYQDYLYPAYEVAKEKKIPVIELQHGVVNNHQSYWFEDRRGVNNYTPDYLLTFGDIHNEWVKLVNGCKSISVGFPYQEYMINELRNIIPKEDTVIVYPESDPIFEETIEVFVKNYTQYRVIIKMHPIQAGHEEEYYPILSKNKTVEFVSSQEKGIYYWLKYARHHVMASTTVGLEAMAFDHCNVCIIESIPHDQTQCLLDWGVARGFKTPDELAHLIENPLEGCQNLFEVRDRLWKRNSKENMERFFRTMNENEWKYR